MPQNNSADLAALTDQLQATTPALIAVSGGLDSRFLTYIAKKLALPFSAVHIIGPHISEHESDVAIDFLLDMDIPFTVLDIDPLCLPEVRNNRENRCYHCKRAMFEVVAGIAGKMGYNTVMDGSHASDMTGYRPGRQALAELGVKSPLAMAGITKPQIRELALEHGLPDADQPSRPCLLTRLDYDENVDEKLLARIADFEQALTRTGLQQFRLRLSRGNYTLQIASEEMILANSVADSVRGLLRQYDFNIADVVFTASLSGFFDAKRGLDPQQQQTGR